MTFANEIFHRDAFEADAIRLNKFKHFANSLVLLSVAN